MKWIFSIRTKLFVVVFIVSLALIAAVYWQVGMQAQAVANETVKRSLTQSSHIMDTRINSRFLLIQEIASGIANDGKIRPLVYEQQSATLQDLSQSYQNIYQFNSLFFINANGIILARSDQPQAIGVNLAGRTSLFDDALQGQISKGFFASQGKLMQAVVTPIFDNIAKDLVKGAVVLAYELSPDMAQEILDLTQSHIGFFTFKREFDNGEAKISGVQSSYVTDPKLSNELNRFWASNEAIWRKVLNGERHTEQLAINLNGALQHVVLKPVLSKDSRPLGFVMSLRSDAQLRQPFEEIRRALLIDGVIALLVASVLAATLAIGFSRPIIRLVDTVQNIQSGVYPANDQKTSSLDEVGILHNAVIQMGQSIQEKAELEAYLADLAEDVEDDSSAQLEHALDKTTLIDESDETIVQLVSQSDEEVIDQRFRLISKLGTGAMGTVYLALDMALNEKLAIKVIEKDSFETLEDFNFKEEIRLARKITHRNIVRTFDFGVWGDKLYISMEFVAGYDLGKLISRKGALDLSIGLALCKQICSAMISAHQIGVIHRDLKPANMIINRQGVLKIMDFGLAMQLQSSAQPDLLAQDNSQSGSYIMGTPRYMAPEQFSLNAELDARTDIYSIGVIMFTIFNGAPPYKGKNLKDIAQLHQSAPIPPISNSRKPIPELLFSIITKAMAKQPDERFNSVKAMYEALARVSL